MKKILLVILTSTTVLFSPQTSAFTDVDGNVIISVVKRCFFHHELYESHLSIETPCTFNIGNPPSDNDLVNIAKRHIAHDPECFSERNEQVY